MVILKVKDMLDIHKLDCQFQSIRDADTSPTGPRPTTDAAKLIFELKRWAPTAANLRGTQVHHVQQMSEGVVLEHVRVPELMYVRFDVCLDCQ